MIPSNRVVSERRKILDVGFNNGDDTAYYLHLGYDVVAVEANQALVEQGHQRFHDEIASGCLTIVHAALCPEAGQSVRFFINNQNTGWSSTDESVARDRGTHTEVLVPGISLLDLFRDYGTPHYLKIDIEGSDAMALRSLADCPAMPPYFSCELGHGVPAVDDLERLGYSAFKLINPETLTQSVQIFERETFIRALRKASTQIPPVRSIISALPFRPRKTLWDEPKTRLPYEFSPDTTGPFGEMTDGPWHPAVEMRQHLDWLYRRYSEDQIVRFFWYDLHARHSAYKAV